MKRVLFSTLTLFLLLGVTRGMPSVRAQEDAPTDTLFLPAVISSSHTQARAREDVQPITSQAPWREVAGAIATAGEAAEYSFNAVSGQVVALDLIIPDGSELTGNVRIYSPENGSTINDGEYERATSEYGPDSPAGLTAEIPANGTYHIEIDPSDSGAGTTGAYLLRFNLISPQSSISVDDDLAQCPGAVTGSVRAAVHAVGSYGTVTVCEGEYEEQQDVIVSRQGVTIAGAGVDLVTIRGHRFSNFIVRAPGVTISDLSLVHDYIYNESIRLEENATTFTLERCHISGHHVGVSSSIYGTPHHDLHVSECIFELTPVHATGSTSSGAILARGDRAVIHNNQINVLADTYIYSGIAISGNDARIFANTIGSADVPSTVSVAISVRGENALVEENTILSYALGVRISAGNEGVDRAVVRNNLFGSNIGRRGGNSGGITVERVRDAEVSGNFIRGYPDLLSHGIRFSNAGGVSSTTASPSRGSRRFTMSMTKPCPIPSPLSITRPATRKATQTKLPSISIRHRWPRRR